ncbi:MAG TPA: fused MFS/spermidine synthase [Thermoanaerobaculaceae bacterium]|nr:fused MFS/spermidine synthase [Thermoanaerobaculaceae bacterium]HRS17517.1 fused MFS/spermidine synthase [Thermoanaerobaculaceae bacterium]
MGEHPEMTRSSTSDSVPVSPGGPARWLERWAGVFLPVAAFVGAFLLFAVELILGKHLLPYFGGAPALWTGCLLLYQVLLLAGYALAHMLIRRSAGGAQRWLFALFLVASLASLAVQALRWGVPLLPPPAWVGGNTWPPLARQLVLLLAAAGVPFVTLAATTSLVGAWSVRLRPGRPPWRLYALSNAGSLLGLATYPLLVEPGFEVPAQAVAWTCGFVVYAAAMGWCAWAAGRRPAAPAPSSDGPGEPAAVPPGTRVLWLLLAATGSALLMAVTNQVCQEVAVVPLLWALPLGAYLLSMIIVFERPRRYHRGFWGGALAICTVAACLALYWSVDVPAGWQIGIWLAYLLAACTTLHGELAALRPPTSRLTAYYLAIAVGGAAGGVLVAVAAPAWLDGMFELHLGMLAAGVLALVTLIRNRGSWLWEGRIAPPVASLLAVGGGCGWLLAGGRPDALRRLPQALAEPANLVLALAAGAALLALARRAAWRRRAGLPMAGVLCLGTAVGVLGVALRAHAGAVNARALFVHRDYYGVVRVEPTTVGTGSQRAAALALWHGRIVHGFQLAESGLGRLPTAYFGRGSGVGRAVELLRRRHPDRGLRAGVIGLGVGTLAAYGRAGDSWRFYELSPTVAALAEGEGGFFSFLQDSPADVEVVVGDGRLALAGELEREGGQSFDLLVMDAFSSGAVPVHLLTREAVALYLAHLGPDGVLALNLSSRNLALAPVAWRLAEAHGLSGMLLEGYPSADGRSWHSLWMLLSRQPELLAEPELAGFGPTGPAPGRVARLWTDAYSAPIAVLRWGWEDD